MTRSPWRTQYKLTEQQQCRCMPCHCHHQSAVIIVIDVLGCEICGAVCSAQLFRYMLAGTGVLHTMLCRHMTHLGQLDAPLASAQSPGECAHNHHLCTPSCAGCLKAHGVTEHWCHTASVLGVAVARCCGHLRAPTLNSLLLSSPLLMSSCCLPGQSLVVWLAAGTLSPQYPNQGGCNKEGLLSCNRSTRASW